jgi:undecaprenyl-diphosphatase
VIPNGRRCLAWAAAALVASLAITVAVATLGTPALDSELNRAASSLRDGVVGTPLRALSWIGYASRIVPLVILLDVVLVVRRRRDEALAVSLAALVGLAAFATVKRIVERPRPPHPDHAVAGWSMPSGHATIAFAIAAALLLALPELRRRWWCVAGLLAWAALTAASRVVLGVHYLTDVLAGALLGTASALLAVAAVQWRGRAR